MEDKKLTNIIDSTLTPQNACEKGYVYIDDVIYNVIAPSAAMSDILQFITTYQCKLGTPAQGNPCGPFYGLYIPKK